MSDPNEINPSIEGADVEEIYGAAAARYVDVFMEAIRWDNAVKLYDRYSRDT